MIAADTVKSRAAVLRFTTHDGREVETVSSLSSHPGPRPGRRLTVDDDPADPEGTAERPGVRRLQLFLCPLPIAAARPSPSPPSDASRQAAPGGGSTPRHHLALVLSIWS